MKNHFSDSYCGLFCGACEIQAAFQRQEATHESATWEDLPEEFSRHIKRAKIACHGCKSDDVFEGCAGCKVRKCAKEKEIDFCFECSDFPCLITRELERNIEKLSEVLPHTKGILANLEDIRKMGKEKWLEKEAKLWSCSRCGQKRTWYQKKCGNCGASIGEAF